MSFDIGHLDKGIWGGPILYLTPSLVLFLAHKTSIITNSWRRKAFGQSQQRSVIIQTDFLVKSIELPSQPPRDFHGGVVRKWRQIMLQKRVKKNRYPTGIYCMAQETQTGALYQPRGVGWRGRWEGGSKGRGYMYIYGWFMLRFDREQQNSVKHYPSIKT